MKVWSKAVSGRRWGFTLLELLVVIAILALLAAVLLPALARGKANAKSAACKSNLRQLGLALNMYVHDYDKYPGNAALYDAEGFAGIWGGGMNWLVPYVGRRAAESFHQWNEGSRSVFGCPAVHPQFTPGLFGAPGKSLYSLDYGYNELGTGWQDGRLQLGLGFTVELSKVRGYEGDGLPFGARHYVKPGDVRAPPEMISIGDGTSWMSPNSPSGVITDAQKVTILPRHKGRANVAFTDGHSEEATGEKWVEESDPARKRWNNDNQPHPETW